MQNQMLPSFLITRTMELLHSLLEGSMTPNSSMTATSSSNTGTNYCGMRYILCLMGVLFFRRMA